MNQEDIYKYLKFHKGAKFKTRHLAKIYDCNRKTLEAYLTRMFKKQEEYKGLKRDLVLDKAETGRDFTCYQYYVEKKLER